MKLILRTAARGDILSQVAYLLEESAFGAAARFPEATEEAFEQIRKNPGIGAPRQFDNPRLKGLRSWPVPGFEHIRIYYLQPDRHTIRVVRILHGKRDLGRILGSEQA